MIEVQRVLVQEDVVDRFFLCSLEQCKGACCIEGDSGAPLLAEELPILERVYPFAKPYMSPKGIATIEQQGCYVTDFEGDYTTPCVDGNKECAYVHIENGLAQCAIEKAYEATQIDWPKPISCHLYPIRIRQYPDFEVLNYDRWAICTQACVAGEAQQVPLFRFLKTALIRKYGKVWFEALEQKALL